MANTQSATVNTSWVDAMRASSLPRNSGEDNQQAWIIKHPSALGVFEEETMTSAGMKQVVIFLDYDGTLSPFVTNPDIANMDRQVYGFVRLKELYYAGSHGMDIKGPSSRKHQKGNPNVLCQPAKEFLPIMTKVYKILKEKTKRINGVNVESNKFCLSVHYRCVKEESWSVLANLVNLVVKDYSQLKLTQGVKVLEIRPTIEWDKGKAIEFLLESLGYGNSTDVLPIYIGDDRTNEDAFKVLQERGQGFGILVSKTPKETYATYTLQEPSEVMCFLQRLVTWKSSILCSH